MKRKSRAKVPGLLGVISSRAGWTVQLICGWGDANRSDAEKDRAACVSTPLKSVDVSPVTMIEGFSGSTIY
jgi:hypothetical protein